MNYARGEYYANVDADDILPRTKISRRWAICFRIPRSTACSDAQEWINPPPWLTRDHRFGDLDGIPMNSLVLRTEIIRELGGFIDAQGGDIDFLVRLRQEGTGWKSWTRSCSTGDTTATIASRRRRARGPCRSISLKNKLDRDRARAKAKTA